MRSKVSFWQAKAVDAVSHRGADETGGRVRCARSDEQELINGSVSVALPLASPLSLAAYLTPVSVIFNASHFD